MKQALKFVRKLLENFALPAWVLTADGAILYMNKELTEIFGDLTGQNAALVYGSAQPATPAPGRAGFVTDLTLADIPFRRLTQEICAEDGTCLRIEFFEDVSESKLIRDRMEREMNRLRMETSIAKSIQNSILPINDTYWNTIALSTVFLPAEDLSGDFYDLLRLSADEYLIYIADVAGHGIQASLTTVFMKERVRAHTAAALEGTDLLLEKLVEDFCNLRVDGSIYLTLVLCKYDKTSHTLSVCNAGHNCEPLIIRNSGRSELVHTRGLPISVIAAGEKYEEEIVSLTPGDRLILFTDGVVEEVDPVKQKSFGPEGVRELAERLCDYSGDFLAHAMIEESDKYSLLTARDDRTIVIADFLS